MGRGAGTLAGGSLLASAFLGACAGPRRGRPSFPETVSPSSADELLLAGGLRSRVLIREGDVLNARGERFGAGNDFLALIPREGDSDCFLWVNHEYCLPVFVSGKRVKPGEKRAREDVLREEIEIGGSVVRVRRDGNGEWNPVLPDPANRRITGRTPIPFAWPEKIAGSRRAVGTIANCGGGTTPWGTILTCEENFEDFYGDVVYAGPGKTPGRSAKPSDYGWDSVFPRPPEHYGWVVEVDPRTGSAKKLVALGRFAHESATVRVAGDGRAVVYSGDDSEDRCLYKFIASKPGSLEEGELYAADLRGGRWLPLSPEKNPLLRGRFASRLESLVFAREAAAFAGATLLDRPEDIEICPRTGAVFVALTNNIDAGRPFGSLLKIEEKGNDPLALEFASSTFLAGGVESGIPCPDNLAFDPGGNLWVTSDISSKRVGKGPYAPFGNNGLFYVPMRGEDAGRAFQVASGPVDSEITGPLFPDSRTLFFCVQHPGEETRDPRSPTSHWPDGGSARPRSAVVGITGETLRRLTRA